MEMCTNYAELRSLRDEHITEHMSNVHSLNVFHDRIMENAVHLATEKVIKECGPLPTSFAFFIMGSGGRMEQSMWSDQDHGIIYDSDSDKKETQRYFLQLGQEINAGLEHAGYQPCDGDIVSSNPMWTKSIREWNEQVKKWIEENNWECIRYLLTFFDGRVIHGQSEMLIELKQAVTDYTAHSPYYLKRIASNTGRLRKSIGLWGQFLVKSHGKYFGHLAIKEAIIFPYVNAARLFAIDAKLHETSTSKRLQQLAHTTKSIPFARYGEQFERLIDLRLRTQQQIPPATYDDTHYLPVRKLSASDKRLLKSIIADAHILQRTVMKKFNRG